VVGVQRSCSVGLKSYASQLNPKEEQPFHIDLSHVITP
jgi:hypothetical protein